MSQLRMVARFGLVFAMTGTVLILRYAAMALTPVAPRLERRLRGLIVMTWGRMLMRIIGARVRVVGTPPKPPFFLVSNHLSYVDTFFLSGITGGVLIAREDVQRWPCSGIVAKAGNTLFIDRGDVRDVYRINELIRRELDLGSGVVLYPEAGTSEGKTLRPFKSALLEPPAALGIPVHYCTIHYETFPGDPPASDVVAWHTEIGFMAHARRLLQIRGFQATAIFGPNPFCGTNRKELASSLRTAALEQFRPLQ